MSFGDIHEKFTKFRLGFKKDIGAGLYQEDFDVSTCERDRISDGRQRIHGCYASRNNMHTIIFRKFRLLEFLAASNHIIL